MKFHRNFEIWSKLRNTNNKNTKSTKQKSNNQTFSEETNDRSGPKGESKVDSEHDGGEHHQARADVVLHLDDDEIFNFSLNFFVEN